MTSTIKDVSVSILKSPFYVLRAVMAGCVFGMAWLAICVAFPFALIQSGCETVLEWLSE